MPVSGREDPKVVSEEPERSSGASGPLDAISARRVRLGRTGGSDRSPMALPGEAGDAVWSSPRPAAPMPRRVESVPRRRAGSGGGAVLGGAEQPEVVRAVDVARVP
ncbi:hypothetical protein ACFV16_37385, partial [Streptomyces massasporeus]|uniref:hypothetical protein n=1 Tax=Streptomyces massasporeus TaxID=67324 RepID=UPI0036884310